MKATRGKDGRVFVTGSFGTANETTYGGLVYSLDAYERAVANYRSRIQSGNAFGVTLKKPDPIPLNGARTKIDDVSHVMRAMWLSGNSVEGEAEILDTPAGRALIRDLEGENMRVSAAIRGVGTVVDGVVTELEISSTLLQAKPKLELGEPEESPTPIRVKYPKCTCGRPMYATGVFGGHPERFEYTCAWCDKSIMSEIRPEEIGKPSVPLEPPNLTPGESERSTEAWPTDIPEIPVECTTSHIFADGTVETWDLMVDEVATRSIHVRRYKYPNNKIRYCYELSVLNEEAEWERCALHPIVFDSPAKARNHAFANAQADLSIRNPGAWVARKVEEEEEEAPFTAVEGVAQLLHLLVRDHLPLGVVEGLVGRVWRGDDDTLTPKDKNLAAYLRSWAGLVVGVAEETGE